MLPKLPPLGPKTLRVTRAADADLNEIIDYLEEEAGTAVAGRFADRLDAELAKLAHLGHSGVSREWIGPGLRLTIFASYCIYFRLTDDETIVVRVLHASRDVSQIPFESED